MGDYVVSCRRRTRREIRNMPPYGRKQFHRKEGEILQPVLLSAVTLETIRRGMTEYIFTAQYQQDPLPPAGNIVKRKWLTFYSPGDRPEKFGAGSSCAGFSQMKPQGSPAILTIGSIGYRARSRGAAYRPCASRIGALALSTSN